MIRAEKRKFVTEQNRVQKIKAHLFPNNNLQERVENMSVFYAKYGSDLFNILLQYSQTTEQHFAILSLP